MGFIDNHLGIGLGFKKGMGEDGGLSNFDGDGLLPNTEARHFYYERLITANGGIEDIQDFYGLSLTDFKMAINNVFTSLEICGLTSKIKRWTPRLGSTSNTQCLNAISPISVYDGVFSGGVTFTTNGVVYDGINGKESTGFLVNNFSGINNIGVSFKYVTGTLANYSQMVADSANPPSLVIYNDPLGRFLGYINTANYSGHTVEIGGYYTYNRTTSNILYINGVQEDTVVVTDALVLSASQLCIGGGNVNLLYANATLRQEVFHDALDANESLDLYNILTTFDTALGR